MLTLLRGFSMSRQSFRNIIPKKAIFVFGEIFFDFSHIFFTDLKVLLLFVRSLVPTWTTDVLILKFSLTVASNSSFMTSLVAPGWLMTVTFFDFERPRLLILFSIESPMIMTFSRFLELFSLHCSNGTSLLQLLFTTAIHIFTICRNLSLLAGESWWFIIILASCFVKKLITLSFSNICVSSSETRLLRLLIYFFPSYFQLIWHPDLLRWVHLQLQEVYFQQILRNLWTTFLQLQCSV